MNIAAKTQHTPGPWSWIEQHGQHIVECRQETIAHLDTTNEADADLIAAAPAMLEALEAIRFVCDDISDAQKSGRPGVDTSGVGTLRAIAARAHGAIALAKGER